jgi:threonine/homoserine/homoserine lactone efflux protein
MFRPALLVAAGYAVVLYSMGMAPAYLRTIAAFALFFAALYWITSKPPKKRGESAKENPAEPRSV